MNLLGNREGSNLNLELILKNDLNLNRVSLNYLQKKIKEIDNI